jgi:nitric oxide reductase subunit C
MSEKTLRNIFIFGTLLFLIILGVMAADTLSQVKTLRTPALSADVVAGKDLWEAQNCNDCHTILGIGGYYAPDLTKVIDRRGATWLSAWLANPLVVNTQAKMQNQNLDSVQVENLVAFLTWVGKIDTNGWPPKPITNLGGSAPSGDVLFETKGCNACHQINGKGAQGPGPDLSHIATQKYDALDNSPAFLEKWLADPPAQKPGTTMPKLALSQAEITALVQYLGSLK